MKALYRFTVLVGCLLLPTSTLDAQIYQGECDRAGQVYASMDLKSMFQSSVYKGYEIVPATGQNACFAVGYFDIRLTGATAEYATFSYKSKEFWGQSRDGSCDDRVQPSNLDRGEEKTHFYGEITITKEYTKDNNDVCKATMSVSWSRKSKAYPNLNQVLHSTAVSWDMYNTKLVSIDFLRFIHLEQYM